MPNNDHSVTTKTAARLETARPGRAPAQEQKVPAGTIGFIGLGRMGSVMAANLVAGGATVIGLLHSRRRKSELETDGIETTAALGDLFGCDVVITMLPDDAAVAEIVFGADAGKSQGLAAGLAPGALHISMSTISPAISSQLAAEHTARGQHYLAAPVFGNPDAAKARELYVIAAGDPDQIERARPIFERIGQRIFVAGDDPAAANLIKLAGNAMIATSLEVLGEVMALLRKRGVEAGTFLDIITNTMFGSRVHKIYGGKIVEERYSPPGFAMPLALKDVRLALAEADAAGVPVPSIGIVHDRLLAGLARGYEGLDWSALARVAAEDGVVPEAGRKKTV
jgi:3-hydroxyisobutyrate dehydrogenase-like beta-hydroxyacid dehydrogenase